MLIYDIINIATTSERCVSRSCIHAGKQKVTRKSDMKETRDDK